jgi:hypothetical protein
MTNPVVSIGIHPAWMPENATAEHIQQGPCRVTAVLGATRHVQFVSCSAVPSEDLPDGVLAEHVYEVREASCDATELRWLGAQADQVAPGRGRLLDFVMEKQHHNDHIEPSGQSMRKNS